MKIILSRKGFDSSYGGHSSPILPDGRMLSLPIPLPNKLKYSAICVDKNTYLVDIMVQLFNDVIVNKKRQNLTGDIECHLDPDIYPASLLRHKDWKPLFGQTNSSQQHLSLQGVSIGDLFLFFGWFRQTEFYHGKLCYITSAPDFQCIWGYLQIGKIYNVMKQRHEINSEIYHPHLESYRSTDSQNTQYEATNKLTFLEKQTGCW